MSSSSSSPPPILDLWAQYWNCNPLLETWHCQTFARQVSQNFTSSSKEWTPEIKKTIEVVADDFRVKNIRTFFASNTIDENTNTNNINNDQKEKQQKEQQNDDDAAQQASSSPSSSELLPSSILQFQTNSSSASKPRELFDLFLTLLTSTQENQQPVILDFQFVPVAVQSEGSSSSTSSSSSAAAFVTFTTPIIAQRIASGLQGMAQVKVLSQKDAALHRKNNKAALSSSHILTLRATSDAAEPIFRNNARALQVLFNIFGGSPKLSQVPRKIGGTAYQIEFSSPSSNSQKCPKRLLLSKEQDFSSQHFLSSSEDAAPQNESNDSITNEDVLRFLASGQECAAVALATLQRPLAEDWGLMLTFERK